MWPGDVAGIRVSFVVIAYNEAGNIGRTLDGIAALAGLERLRYEVVVVNDGSRDGTADVVAAKAAHNPHIKLINLLQNCGRGYARATGIAVAQGELIATIDADILLPVNWFIEAEAALADYDAVGGTAMPDGDVAYVYKASRLVPRVVGHTTTVTGSNAFYRREVFDLVAFDPSLREGEDVALNKAIAQHELSFATIPGLIVEHIENKSLPDSVRWLFATGKGATRQLLVYHQVRMPDLVTGVFLTSLLAGVLVAAVASLPIPGVLIPLAVLLVASVQHVRSRFETPLSRLHAVAFAIVLDAAHLLAYFTGRVVGLTWLLDHRANVAINAPVSNSVGRS
jgi:glycosyltransferase involved in cell wall biosynthesis